jgi:hypothetical protein
MATLTNVTIANNRADTSGGGLFIAAGTANLFNTLIAGNVQGATDSPSDIAGIADSATAISSNNLIGDGSGGLDPARANLLGSPTQLLDPLLAPLGDYGGPTLTMALLPGSPAIDTGSPAYAPPTDQRGRPRVGPPDIGAFESQGFTLTASGGDAQSAAVNTAFAVPLAVTVTANAPGEPVVGGLVTFAAPAAGASAVLSGSPARIGPDGTASVTAVADGTAGSYVVTAGGAGIALPATFSLSNTASGPSNRAGIPPAVRDQLFTDLLALPGWDTPQGQAELEGWFWLWYALAASQSQQQANDLVWQEFWLTWDLVLAGGNLVTLAHNPQAAAAQAVVANPLYGTPAGWWMAHCETELLLAYPPHGLAA